MRSKHLLAALHICVQQQRPAMIWGPPGVGKSDIVAQLARDTDAELRDVRLNLLDPTDIKGFPVPNVADGTMQWLPADFMPPMFITKEVEEVTTTGKGKAAKTVTTMVTKRIPNDTKGILFLDELNQAPPSVQAAAYQLLLNRKVGNYELPEGWSVLAAGNRESDRANAQRMPTALSLRLVHFDIDVNVDDWCEWALNQGDRIPVETLAFIRFRSELLHKFDNTQRVSPNPRSWAFVGELTHSGLSREIEMEMFKGVIGEGAAGEYMAFLQVFRDLPSIDKIMMDPEGTPIPDGPSVKFAITAALAAATTKDAFPRFMTYMKRMDTEWVITYVRDALKRTNSAITETKEFQSFAVKNGKFLT